jgi:hypothetical protein
MVTALKTVRISGNNLTSAKIATDQNELSTIMRLLDPLFKEKI